MEEHTPHVPVPYYFTGEGVDLARQANRFFDPTLEALKERGVLAERFYGSDAPEDEASILQRPPSRAEMAPLREQLNEAQRAVTENWGQLDRFLDLASTALNQEFEAMGRPMAPNGERTATTRRVEVCPATAGKQAAERSRISRLAERYREHILPRSAYVLGKLQPPVTTRRERDYGVYTIDPATGNLDYANMGAFPYQDIYALINQVADAKNAQLSKKDSIDTGIANADMLVEIKQDKDITTLAYMFYNLSTHGHETRPTTNTILFQYSTQRVNTLLNDIWEQPELIREIVGGTELGRQLGSVRNGAGDNLWQAGIRKTDELLFVSIPEWLPSAYGVFSSGELSLSGGIIARAYWAASAASREPRPRDQRIRVPLYQANSTRPLMHQYRTGVRRATVSAMLMRFKTKTALGFGPGIAA